MMQETDESGTMTLDPTQDELRRLRLQVTQLTNVIKKLTGQQLESESSKSRERKRRAFDFNLYKRRRVLLRVAYFGWDFHGFAVQETSGKTIESELFRALTLTRLVESRQTSNYHRCGRTDKGVSAFHQVISLDVRSNLMEGEGVYDYEGCRAEERKKDEGGDLKEIEFCKILNSNLPDHIQVIAWAPCRTRDFSARFDCVRRTYKYFFPMGGMNLDLLNDAGRRLCGSHDFRNFCKLDVSNGVVNYIRSIQSVTAEKMVTVDDGPYTMCVLTITGKAFLWHQIRCIVNVLFRVGEGNEHPSIVDELLDIERHPCRPQYGLASEVPLNLFSCEYDDVTWQYEEEAIVFVMRQFQAIWTDHQVKATMIKSALDQLQSDPALAHLNVTNQSECLALKSKAKTYVPLLEMLKCQSLQDKMSKNQAKKRKTCSDDQ